MALGLRSIATNKIKGDVNVGTVFSVLIFLIKFFIYPIDTRLGDMVQLRCLRRSVVSWLWVTTMSAFRDETKLNREIPRK